MSITTHKRRPHISSHGVFPGIDYDGDTDGIWSVDNMGDTMNGDDRNGRIAMATLAKLAHRDMVCDDDDARWFDGSMADDDVARLELIARRAACADDVAWRLGYTDVRHRISRQRGAWLVGTVIDVDVYHMAGNRRYTINVTTYAGDGTPLGRGRVIR